MRLIDADALKKLMEEECAEECAICCYANSGDGCRCKLIDNAPTVELTEEYDLPNTHIDVYSYRCGWNEALNRAGIALKSGIRPIRRQKNDK